MTTKKILLALAAMGLVAFAAPAVYAQDSGDDASMTDVPADPDSAGDDSMSSPEGDSGDTSGDMGDGAAMDSGDGGESQPE